MNGDGAPGDFANAPSVVGNGRYQLQSLLGQGGMASVHLAHDTVLDRPVAVKTLHTELGREQSFRERFRREAQAVAKLNHTNIVSVFDSGEDVIGGATVQYIVMEYVEGKPLREVLDEDVAQHGAMPTEKALKITSDVLAALDASHEMGLVHRDIKPGNVMVTARGVVKVMDFGIARALQSGVTSMTQTGMVVGTPQYLSPEQALGRGVDARSDLYSVGCMLFELLTGRLPFDGDSPLSIAYQHVQEEPPTPSSINQAVPPAVDALVARALRKNPGERFPTAEAMRDEAERVSDNRRGGGTPLIIGEGPRAHGNSGQGVTSAIFPQVSGTMPGMQGDVQTPYQTPPGYQPAAFAPHHTPAPGPVGPATPPPNLTPTPAPIPMNAPGPIAPPGPRPAPFVATPRAPQQNNGCGTAAIIVGVVVAIIIAVITIVIIMAIKSASSHIPDPPSIPTTDARSSVKPGDASAVMAPSECNQQAFGGDMTVPLFMFKYIDSVRACADAGGWKLVEKEDNESIWGQGMVVDQEPGGGNSRKPGSTITIWVSTGHE